jgi:hypothetical protein
MLILLFSTEKKDSHFPFAISHPRSFPFREWNLKQERKKVEGAK